MDMAISEFSGRAMDRAERIGQGRRCQWMTMARDDVTLTSLIHFVAAGGYMVRPLALIARVPVRRSTDAAGVIIQRRQVLLR